MKVGPAMGLVPSPPPTAPPTKEASQVNKCCRSVCASASASELELRVNGGTQQPSV